LRGDILSHNINAGIFLHPWDILDEGAEQVFSRIKETGIGHVNLATSYHSGRYILPHNPKRKIYFAEEGVVYFHPDSTFYEDTPIKPRMSSQFPDVDVVALATQEARKHGIGVNSWTVTLHNSRLGRTHPEVAVVNAYGDTDYNFLCPNNPDSRKFLIGLVRNLAEKYQLEAIQLESAGYIWGLEHGDHHEMLGTQIEPFTSDLMGICFCKNCIAKMEQEKLDPNSLRRLVRSIADLSFDTPTDVLHKIPVEETLRNSYVLSTDIEELHELLRFKRAAVNSLFEEARDALKSSNPNTKLHVIAAGGFTGGGSGAMGRGSEGINLHDLAEIVDGIDLIDYVSDPEMVYYHVQWVKFEVGSCPIYVALRPSYPTLYARESIEGEVVAAMQAGANGVEFYNYGWTSLRNLGWVKQSLEAASSKLC
jgi:hypothetical protein